MTTTKYNCIVFNLYELEIKNKKDMYTAETLS